MAKKQKQSRKAHGGGESTKESTNSSSSTSSSTAAAASTATAASAKTDKPQSFISLPEEFDPSTTTTTTSSHHSLLEWIQLEQQSLLWILGCAILGAFLGFGVGAGWFTRGYGSWHFVMKDATAALTPSAADGKVSQEFVRKFIITPWRVTMAYRMRNTLLYELVTFKKAPWAVVEYLQTASSSKSTNNSNSNNISKSDEGWFQSSPMWPPNWILFRQVDLSNIDVGEGGLSPSMMKFLSIVLPWRRSLIKALAKKEKKSNNNGKHVVDNLRRIHPVVDGGSTTSFSSKIKRLLFGASANSQGSGPVDPYYHPMGFYALREYIVRYDNGYVHPDLGFLVPAPSGASRGLGMVANVYTKCQRDCFPGTLKEWEDKERDEREKLQELKEQQMAEQEIMNEMKEQFPELSSSAEGSSSSSHPPRSSTSSSSSGVRVQPIRPITNATTLAEIEESLNYMSISTSRTYSQQEVLLRIPLEAQITRSVAVDILKGILPEELMKNGIGVLDDAFVLTLLLAHERGLGESSRFWPYIATLPPRPLCALYPESRQSVVDVVTALAVEMGTDVVGWPNEISKAAEVSERIVANLSMQYKLYLATSAGSNVVENLRWALCQVASRAVAGNKKHGSLRLVPMMDLINHDEAADKFHEVIANETISNDTNDVFFQTDESDAGAFVVRSQRHGRAKPLKAGQELMANYNVPNYSPLDWFINMGFVPPERTGKWKMLESGLPRSYRGGFSRKSTSSGTTGVGAFGSGKPEIQVIRQHTTHTTQQQTQVQQTQQSPAQQSQGTCQR